MMKRISIVILSSLLSFIIACGSEDSFGDVVSYPCDNPNSCMSDTANTLLVDSIIITHWNIGHFSRGGATSNITSAIYESKKAEFCSLISETNSDLISLNEYSQYFGVDEYMQKQEANTALFSEYPFQEIGRQSRYSCNALFSKYQLSNVKQLDYICNQIALITHTDAIKATDYYILEGELTLNGNLVKLVSTHLAFDKNNEDVARNQMLEIIERYQSEEYVIICGDWNTKAINFDLFSNAGFELSNHGIWGDLITRPKSSGVIDNIIVRGFNIEQVNVLKTSLSDHYPIRVVLKFKE